jgi:hypothetical protein
VVPDVAESPRAAAGVDAAADDERVAALERAVEELRAGLAAVRAELEEFRAQFQ